MVVTDLLIVNVLCVDRAESCRFVIRPGLHATSYTIEYWNTCRLHSDERSKEPFMYIRAARWPAHELGMRLDCGLSDSVWTRTEHRFSIWYRVHDVLAAGDQKPAENRTLSRFDSSNCSFHKQYWIRREIPCRNGRISCVQLLINTVIEACSQ